MPRYTDLGMAPEDLRDALNDALNAERAWEETMKRMCGEDGPASVALVVMRLVEAARNVARAWPPDRPWTRAEYELLNAIMPFAKQPEG